MFRSLRAVTASAALLVAAGLLMASEATATDAKPPVVTDISAAQKKVIVAPRRVIVGPKRVIVAPKRVIVGPRVVGPRVVGPRRFTGPLILGGRHVTVIRGPRSVFWRGHRRSLIPLAAIGAITVGAIAYRAHAYVPVEQPVCAGQTPDGCELRWQEVPTPEGDLIPQCVQFCPQEP